MRGAPRALLLFLAVLASIAQAGRVALSDIGLTAWVPTGWALEKPDPVESPWEYMMYDTSGGGMRAVFTIQAFDSAWSAGSSRQWTVGSALSWRLFIENDPCYGWVFKHDSTMTDGIFSVYVSGEWGGCIDSGATGAPATSPIYSQYVRAFAFGSTGWEAAFVSDSIDVEEYYEDYVALVDSLRIESGFRRLSTSPARRAFPGGGLLATPDERGGFLIHAREPFAADASLRIVGADGRDLRGDLSRKGDGWLWKPRPGTGIAIAVVRSRGRRWTTTLPPFR